MPDKAIQAFFEERKQAWLKKEVKASMDDETKKGKFIECENLYSYKNWIGFAIDCAHKRVLVSHVCKFTHPDTGCSKASVKNKTFVSPTIFDGKQKGDGFLRSGNVNNTELDSIGNGTEVNTAGEVGLLLSRRLSDGKRFYQHVKESSEQFIEFAKNYTSNIDDVKTKLLDMLGNSEPVTNSKIKQVYFPIPDETASDGYHQLSLLTNSGIVFEMRRRLDAVRFGVDEASINEQDENQYLTKDELKVAREKRRNNEYFVKSFDEVYGLTTIGFGGSQPNNISVLCNQYAGKAHLLLSTPPSLEERSFRFPTSDFFTQSISPYQVKSAFEALHRVFKTNASESVIPKKNLKAGRDNRLAEITDHIIENMWQARNSASQKYVDSHSKLKQWQKVWLLDEYFEVRQQEEQWLETLTAEIKKWIVASYRKIIAEPCTLGESELQFIQAFVEQYKEALR